MASAAFVSIRSDAVPTELSTLDLRRSVSAVIKRLAKRVSRPLGGLMLRHISLEETPLAITRASADPGARAVCRFRSVSERAEIAVLMIPEGGLDFRRERVQFQPREFQSTAALPSSSTGLMACTAYLTGDYGRNDRLSSPHQHVDHVLVYDRSLAKGGAYLIPPSPPVRP